MCTDLNTDICCRSCQLAANSHGSAVDYWCVDCCVRMLDRQVTDEMVDGHLRSIERITAERPEHAVKVKAKWGELVAKREIKGK